MLEFTNRGIYIHRVCIHESESMNNHARLFFGRAPVMRSATEKLSYLPEQVGSIVSWCKPPN